MKDIDEQINKRVITNIYAETICHKTLFCVNLQFYILQKHSWRSEERRVGKEC